MRGRTPDSSRSGKSAGLPLSVGAASLPLRLFLAFLFLAISMLCAAGGVIVSRAGGWPMRILAALLIEPIAIVGLIATAFIAAPYSRFGVWLDHFVPRLREGRVAVVTAIVIIAIGFAIVSLPLLPSARGEGAAGG